MPRYITTPIYYVNDKPHIGHAFYLLTGTDEHGQKVEKAAADAGEPPQAFTDRVSQAFRDLTGTMGLSNNGFIRTTEKRHYEACQALWRKLEENGHIYLGAYEGWYAVRDEAFYGEDELTERDGVKYAPSGAPVAWVKEPSYFFRLSAFGDKLLVFYEKYPDFILPATRRNEVIAFVKSDLRDLSVSRTSFAWGVPVPGDASHVMYVWLDALTNYITALGYPTDPEALWKFWPADIHFVGKDILRFHAIYWPAFLMGAGLPLPQRVFAHGWWTNEGQKISKSLGNVIDPVALVDEFGLDAVRYFMLREVPFGQDGDFSRKALVNRLNGELADALGNLANRVLSLLARNCEGHLPAPAAATEAGFAALLVALPAVMTARMERQEFHNALEAVFEVIREANAYITREAPWALKKTDPTRMEAVLRNMHDALRVFATLLQPFMPGTMAKLLDQLGVPAELRDFAALATPLPAGQPIGTPSPLFTKVVA
ncbi:MAG: methionine--tRNA ligase [Alphaproteobacteria bacterium]|nr:methionine--tRNA ligase [Alphaproteobacteria bacterium]